jgi:hypothetical protein
MSDKINVEQHNSWVDAYIELCLQGNYEKAFSLKKANKPETGKLYQYRSVEKSTNLAWLFNLLDTGKIYCNSIRNLNDPFDSRSTLSFKTLNEYCPDGTLNPEWLDKINSLPDNGYDKDLKEAYHIFVDELSTLWEFNSAECDALEQLNKNINRIFDMIRVASFSEKYNNITMWAHYANEHRGICLEFDIEKIDDDIFNRHIHRVQYVNVLPDGIKCLFNRLTNNKIVNVSKLIIHCGLKKLIDWEYETEWRYISQAFRQDRWTGEVRSRSEISDDNANEGRTSKFAKPSKLMLGVKIDKDVKELLCKKATSINLPVYQMTKTQWGLSWKPNNDVAFKDCKDSFC